MTETFRLDLPLLLPEIPDESDACIGRLTEMLGARPGIGTAHVVAAAGGAPAQLCVHYDPDILSLARIREIVRAAGAAISDRYGHILWEVAGIGHARRARTIAESLRALTGVIEADASVAGMVRVEYDREQLSSDDIRAELTKLGAVAQPAPKKAGDHHGHDHARDRPEPEHAPGDGHDHAHGGVLGPNTELIFALACGTLLAIGFGIEKLVAGAPEWLPTALYIGAYGFGGFFTLREAIDNLRLKKFEIDTLMLVAAAGAAALGAFAEGALLLFLFSLGHALEHYAMGRAKRAIEALAELAPRRATVRRADGGTSEVPVEDLKIGEIVVVKPDERVAADGFVVKGTTAIDQAPVTGESMPVDKRPVMDDAAARANPDRVDAAHRVFAGTINGSGLIEIEVTRLSTESTLAKVVKLVSEAETQKSPTQRFTDRFERVFVPAVLTLAFVLLFAWVVVDEPFRDSFYRAMAVLVAASPCALAIATPSAVLSGVARAARGGVLIKGGAPLELLGSLDAIAFDKTGTLTKGKPRIQQVITAPGVSKEDMMAVAVAVESLSDHPLAQAIARDGREHIGASSSPRGEPEEPHRSRRLGRCRWTRSPHRQGRDVRHRRHRASLAGRARHPVAAPGDRADDHDRPPRRAGSRRHRVARHATTGSAGSSRTAARNRHPAHDHDFRRSPACRRSNRQGRRARRSLGRSPAREQGRRHQEAARRCQGRDGWRRCERRTRFGDGDGRHSDGRRRIGRRA